MQSMVSLSVPVEFSQPSLPTGCIVVGSVAILQFADLQIQVSLIKAADQFVPENFINPGDKFYRDEAHIRDMNPSKEI